MDVYKSETREVIRRFLGFRLSFPDCIAALDSALADLTTRMTGAQLATVRAVMMENNNIVMQEMARRGPPPSEPNILAALGDGVTPAVYQRGQTIYGQGDSGEQIFYIQKGRVNLTVVSKFGKKAIMGVLGAGSFLGERCLKEQPHAATATTMIKSSVLRLDKRNVLRALDENAAFSGLFRDHLLSRNLRIEEDIIYQVLNSNERRLARVLLLMANFGEHGAPKTVLPKISFESLAERVGTTISKIGFFMRKFRKLGFIEYNGELKIHSSLLNVVLHDQFAMIATHPAPVRKAKLEN